ncbi:hypothetical protein PAE9249_04550 [Paenibacillus sp. CECT 9249]|uniref:DUF3775 domain-containing protein n=1 Tax=Paenibacillus sp. CECT 9249 TaxID=2845385 RepID=UPI001E3C2CFA|nr:DUF3775 domain-containing protein [Paenibacillus sp. CECT 9249]CAH0122013.1 hypothetical protein PAE9249_04550 [Paenibacillus sp. CECT 9249]
MKKFKVVATELFSQSECYLVDTNSLPIAFAYAKLAFIHMQERRYWYPNCCFEVCIEWLAEVSRTDWRGKNLSNTLEFIREDDIWIHPFTEHLTMEEQDFLFNNFLSPKYLRVYATREYSQMNGNPVFVVRLMLNDDNDSFSMLSHLDLKEEDLMANKFELIKQTIALARERDRNIEKYGLKCIVVSPDGYKEYKAFLNSPEYLKIQSSNKILRDFLASLEPGEVGLLYTMMYLGRDHDYIEVQLDKSGNAAYHDGRNKDLEIDMMMEKRYLSQYLQEGAKIMGYDVE